MNRGALIQLKFNNVSHNGLDPNLKRAELICNPSATRKPVNVKAIAHSVWCDSVTVSLPIMHRTSTVSLARYVSDEHAFTADGQRCIAATILSLSWVINAALDTLKNSEWME